jgi:hypothetical protein
MSALAAVLLGMVMAGAPVRVVVVSETASTADGAAQERLREAARAAGERNRGFALSVRDAPCGDTACVDALLDAAEIDAAVLMRVDARGRDYAWRLELVAPGAENLIVEDACEVCGLEEVGGLVEASVGRLLERYARALAPAELALSTTPAGAEVFEGEASLGRTPLEVEVPAGKHTVEFRLAGHEPQRRTLRIVAGERVVVDVELVAVPAPAPAWRPMAIAGGVSLGVGIVAVAAGAALVAIDERSVACTGAEANEFGVCPRRFATLEGGAATLAIGGALLVTGIVLETVALRRRARAKALVHWRGAALKF